VHPESERSLHGPLQSVDLDAEVTRLREEKAWQEGRRNAITLRKGQGLNVVLLVMKEGDRLDEHSAPGPVSWSVMRLPSVSNRTDSTAEPAGRSLCEAVPKVPEGCKGGFWHFWHPVG
jgi:hypothetical protein